jgi:hypothetical protein
MLKWLVTTDPSPDHNTACRRHDAHTGNWLSKSPEYQSWITFRTRFLWLYGIPGAGKTVLLSSIIEIVKSRCKTVQSKDVACVYYYCYFGRSQDETSPLLRWIIDQLIRCCQYIPNEILDCFRAGQQPSVSTLVVALSSLAKKFQKIYLFVDALDESLERQNVLDLLLTLAGPGFDNISLLVTSREKIDIKIAIGSTTESISLSNPYVDDDIRTYVRNQVKLHRKLSVLEPALRTEIEDGLVQGAKGMYVSRYPLFYPCICNLPSLPRFRWAACQIDVLGRLHNASDIRKALSELPETLEDIYERILLGIHPRHRRIAQKVLALLAFHSDIFDDDGGAAALAEAAIIDVERLKFDPKDRLLSHGDLFEICSCLITESGENGVKLAHYTVKEFLVSERIKNSPATEFQTSEDIANGLICKTMLIYLLENRCDLVPQAADYFSWSVDEKDRFYYCVREDFPFMHDSISWSWYSRDTKNAADRRIIDGLVLRLFDPKGLHYNHWLEWEDIQTSESGYYIPRWGTRVGFEANIALAYAVYFEQPRTTMELIISQYPDLPNSSVRLELEQENVDIVYEHWLHGTPLEMAIIHRHESLIELLLEKGADPNSSSYTFHPSPLCTALNNYWDETGSKRKGTCDGSVRLLIAAGADPNPRRTVQTPLQLAAQWASYHVVEFLLDNGADVNAIGNDDAIVADIERSWVEWGENNEDDLQESILGRGTNEAYLTPLRIASRRYIRHGDALRPQLEAEKSKIEDLLRQRGGKSLCLFPVKDLPSYVEEDMEVMSTLTSRFDLPPNHSATGAPKFDGGAGDTKPSEF